MGLAKQEELAQEPFALLRVSLELIQPWVLVLCQCFTKLGHEWWGFFDNMLTRQLCSSVEWAKLG